MFKNAPTVNITSLSFDSRTITKGSLYFCLPGLMHDGHEFIDAAIDKGAIAIVHTKDIENPRAGAIYIKVADAAAAMNQAARIFYNRPSDSLMMFGVTGTNGKSTITNIIRHLAMPEIPTGYIGTIAITYGHVNLMPDLTTPDAIFLQKTLRDMVDAGMKACSMEVSSHGLAQKRVDGIDYDVAVFSNFTYDHLDFHGTMENYFEAKSKLFKERLKDDGVAVLNADDPKFEELKSLSKGRVVAYGVKNPADYRAINVEMTKDRIVFDLVTGPDEIHHVETNLAGEFNLYNLLAAIAAVNESRCGIPLDKLLEKVKCIPQVAGRMEQIREGQPFNVIVDFAHTPDGLEKMMQFGRSITRPGGSLILVTGSAGKRDIAKRRVFGELAEKYCNSVFLTEDDPRDEDPREIAAEIRSGMDKVPAVYVPSRYEAIRQAIEAANEGDTVLILGKGDELFMYMKDGREPWMGDNNAAKECIARRYGNAEGSFASEDSAENR